MPECRECEGTGRVIGHHAGVGLKTEGPCATCLGTGSFPPPRREDDLEERLKEACMTIHRIIRRAESKDGLTTEHVAEARDWLRRRGNLSPLRCSRGGR